MKKAVVLLSGGLDSTTVLAIAKQLGYEIYALSFRYGQRHEIELESAKKIAVKYGVVEHKIAQIDLRVFGGSALTDNIHVPKDQISTRAALEVVSTKSSKELKGEIPVTYVPARNTIFLSYALAYAEVIGAFDIFIGVNAVDYSNYPDCRPEFIKNFETLANVATAAGTKGEEVFVIHAPLIKMSKWEIIKKGLELNIDYSVTHSCYDPILKDGKIYSCGRCDSCQLRLKGFEEAGLADQIKYKK